MAKLDKMMAGTANYRMGKLIETFGADSEVYKMASDYIEERVDEKYIKRAKESVYDSNGAVIIPKNSIIGIRQVKTKYVTEEVDDPKYGKVVNIKAVEQGTPDSVFGRSDIFDTYLPSPQQLLNTVKEEFNIEGSVKDNKKHLINLAEVYAKKMRSYDTTVSDVYDVLNNVDMLDVDQFEANGFKEDAEKLLSVREKTSAWIEEAKKLADEYDMAVQLDRQSRT